MSQTPVRREPLPGEEFAYFAHGCFWGTEDLFRKQILDKRFGVTDCEVGYIGGVTAEQPTYKTVCSKTTGYLEGVKVTFNPAVVTYKELVEFFYATHDPTDPGGQGGDRGSNYLSAIFPSTAQQQKDAGAGASIRLKVNKAHGTRTIATLVKDARPVFDGFSEEAQIRQARAQRNGVRARNVARAERREQRKQAREAGVKSKRSKPEVSKDKKAKWFEREVPEDLKAKWFEREVSEDEKVIPVEEEEEEPEPAWIWWRAEAYHQDYLTNFPEGYHCPIHRFWWVPAWLEEARATGKKEAPKAEATAAETPKI